MLIILFQDGYFFLKLRDVYWIFFDLFLKLLYINILYEEIFIEFLDISCKVLFFLLIGLKFLENFSDFVFVVNFARILIVSHHFAETFQPFLHHFHFTIHFSFPLFHHLSVVIIIVPIYLLYKFLFFGYCPLKLSYLISKNIFLMLILLVLPGRFP